MKKVLPKKRMTIKIGGEGRILLKEKVMGLE